MSEVDLVDAHHGRPRNSSHRSVSLHSARNSYILDALHWLDDHSNREDQQDQEESTATSGTGKIDAQCIGKAAEEEQRPARDSALAPQSNQWSGENDPANPQNWSSSRKWTNMVVVGWICFVTPLASSMLAPGLPQIAKDFHISRPSLTAFSLSVFLLGSGTSALLAAPLSELYGRVPVYHASNVGFTIFTMSCGLSPGTAALVTFRFLAGCFGSACLAIGMGTCADLFSAQWRARAGSTLVTALMLGPCVGPVLGGLLIGSWAWRSVFYALTCLGGINILLGLLFLRETYAPVILRCRDRVLKSKGPDSRATILMALKRPLKMMALSPVVTLVCLASAMVYSILYLVVTTIPFVFAPRYNFSSFQTGLLYLAPGIGMVVGLVTSGQLSDRIVTKQSTEHVPEDRLPFWITIPATIAMSCGLIIYGWTTHVGLYWAVPLVGLALFGAGLTAVTSSSQMYSVECHIAYAASVSAASSVLRSLTTGLMPLGALGLYRAIGIGWGSTLLAGLAAVAAMILFICRIHGRVLRSRFPVKL